MMIFSQKNRTPDWRTVQNGKDYFFTDAKVDNAIVDIRMLTYNHEKYIRHAIESVLMQETQYPYRLIISDDCSTDGTVDIIREYQEKYPNRIATIMWNYNTGRNFKGINGLTLARQCTAKYLAMLEGDDYWTDLRKLDKAISFLEEHPKYIGYAHNIRIVDKNEDMQHWLHPNHLLYAIREEHIYADNSVRNMRKLQSRIISQTGSLVCRNIWKDWDDEKYELWKKCDTPGDMKFTVCLGNLGMVYYSRDIMSDYRKVYDEGSWTAIKEKQWNARTTFDFFNSLYELNKNLYGNEVPTLKKAAVEESYIAAEEDLLRRFTLKNIYMYLQILYLINKKKLTEMRKL